MHHWIGSILSVRRAAAGLVLDGPVRLLLDTHVMIAMAIIGLSGCQVESDPQPGPAATIEIAGAAEVGSKSKSDRVPITLSDLYDRHAIASFEKQQRFSDHLQQLEGEPGWQIDPRAGELELAGTTTYAIDLLGSEDLVAEDWLWCWGNPNMEDVAAQRVAGELRKLGERDGIDVFVTPRLSLDQLDGETVAVIASGVADAKAYFVCPYENGRAFVLIVDERLELEVPDRVVRAARIVPQAVGALDITNHRLAIRSYLDHLGFDVTERDGRLLALDAGREVLSVEFDDRDRLVEIAAQRG